MQVSCKHMSFPYQLCSEISSRFPKIEFKMNHMKTHTKLSSDAVTQEAALGATCSLHLKLKAGAV